jgi:aminoglycoside phosphotransferase family enzyme
MSYPHRPSAVRLVETHCSFVFLASPFVFKLKKPVDFGFLDFSTLQKRQFYCQREIDLNRRLCPDMYLGVVPICQDGKKLNFERRGVCIEYAVKMQELAEAYFVKELLQQGRVGPEHMDQIVSVLTRFYDSQSPTAEIESWGTVEKLKISTDENFSQIEPYIGQVTSRAAFETIRSFTSSFTSSARTSSSREYVSIDPRLPWGPAFWTTFI